MAKVNNKIKTFKNKLPRQELAAIAGSYLQLLTLAGSQFLRGYIKEGEK